jgi:hypothetical protein
MAESILSAIQALSQPKRDELRTQAQANIAARNTAASAPPAGTETKAARVLKATGIVNAEHGVVMLIGSLSDAVDLDHDVVDAELLVKCAHEFTGRDQRVFKANHDEPIKAKLVESVTGVPILASGRRLKAGEHIPEDDPIASIGLKVGEGEATAWIVGIKPEDPAIVTAAKDGAIAGASWGGVGTRA